eukprot:scaffold3617_cov119-Isochrysis_galbana.AAC.3
MAAPDHIAASRRSPSSKASHASLNQPRSASSTPPTGPALARACRLCSASSARMAATQWRSVSTKELTGEPSCRSACRRQSLVFSSSNIGRGRWLRTWRGRGADDGTGGRGRMC